MQQSRGLKIQITSLGICLVTLAMGLQAATTIVGAGGNVSIKSVDGGTTWQLITANANNPFLSGPAYLLAVAIDPKDPATWYAIGGVGSSQGLYKTSNSGQTWSANLFVGITPIPGPDSLAIDAGTNTLYMIAGDGYIVESTDSGATWTIHKLPFTPYYDQGHFPSGPPVRTITADPKISGALYAVVDATIFKTTDFGATWSIAVSGLDLPGITASGGLSAGFPVVIRVQVDPRNSQVIYALTNTYPRLTCTHPSPGAQCGLYRSSDGGKTWSDLPLPAPLTYSLAIDPRSGALYAGTQPGGLGPSLLKSVDSGNTWIPVKNGFLSSGGVSGPVVMLDPITPSTVYAAEPLGSVQSKFYRSSDSGSTWTIIPLPSTCIGSTDRFCSSPLSPIFRNVVITAPQAGPPASNTLSNVSGASGQSGPVAVESIVTATGTHLATGTASADLDPPVISLGGTTVTITDAAGVTVQAPIFSVSPTQVNYQIPPGTGLGAATVTITAADGSVTTGQLQITDVAPGVFTLNGAGLVRAYILRAAGGNQFIEDVYQVDASGAVIPRPVTISNGDQVYLLAYGTGFRAAGTSGVTATIGGIGAPVLYAGPLGTQAGVDQFNMMIPPELANSGQQVVQIVLTAGGQVANTVNLTVK